MGGGGMVGLALMVEALLLGAMVLVLLGSASSRSLRRRRLAPRMGRAGAAIRGHFAGRDLSAAQRAELLSLPGASRVRLLADLGAALDGDGRDRLTDLARDLDLVGPAERRCSSRLWWRRLRGVRLLIVLGGGTGSVPALLFDGNREVRAAAATWSADHPEPGSVERLLDLLGDGEPLVRFAAKNALLRIGVASVGPLARRLPRVTGRELEGALEVAIGLAEPRLAAPSRPLVQDGSARIRSLAATLAAAIGDTTSVTTVEGLLEDPAPEVRAAAVAGLGKLGHWPAGPAIALALRDPAWAVRREAALALRALGAPGLVLLRRALVDEDRYARDMARQVLDLPGSPDVAPRGLELSA